MFSVHGPCWDGLLEDRPRCNTPQGIMSNLDQKTFEVDMFGFLMTCSTSTIVKTGDDYNQR